MMWRVVNPCHSPSRAVDRSATILATVSMLSVAGCLTEPAVPQIDQGPHAVAPRDMLAAPWAEAMAPAAMSLALSRGNDVHAVDPGTPPLVIGDTDADPDLDDVLPSRVSAGIAFPPPPPPPPLNLRVAPADYDGDGATDISVVDNRGRWYVSYARNGFVRWDLTRSTGLGPSCIAVPADYDGDGRADLSFKCPDTNPDGSIGTWYVAYAATDFHLWDVRRVGYGNATAHPVPADYDGDGRADFSIKGDDGFWLIDYASSPQDGWNVFRSGYGDSTCIPVPADYDGDHKADFSVKCPGATPDGIGTWFVDFASSPQDGWNSVRSGYGDATCVPVPADYDGDGKADYSVRSTSGVWFIDYASSPQDGWNVVVSGYGSTSAVPVPRDYDGDGRADMAALSTVIIPNGSSLQWSIDHPDGNNNFFGWDQFVFLSF